MISGERLSNLLLYILYSYFTVETDRRGGGEEGREGKGGGGGFGSSSFMLILILF